MPNSIGGDSAEGLEGSPRQRPGKWGKAWSDKVVIAALVDNLPAWANSFQQGNFLKRFFVSRYEPEFRALEQGLQSAENNRKQLTELDKSYSLSSGRRQRSGHRH